MRWPGNVGFYLRDWFGQVAAWGFNAGKAMEDESLIIPTNFLKFATEPRSGYATRGPEPES